MDKFAQLQALVHVVEAGSFRKAAERLGVAKSVLSRRLGALEKHLGVQLLRRTTRTLSLTDGGRQFYAQARRILADLDDAEQSMIDASADLRGTLRLAAPLSFGLRHLTAAINDFLHDHPGIELNLDLNDREVNLVEEGFDMALRIGDLRDSTLLARRIGTARFITCASPDYLRRHGTPMHPAELSQHIGLHYANSGLRQAWQFDTGGTEPLVAIPAIRVRANNGDALAGAAIAGLGIVHAPTFIVADAIGSGTLLPILTAYRRPPVGIHAVYPPGRLTPRRVRAFTEFLAVRFGGLPYWDQQTGLSAG